jgi:hypothetical protein
VVDSLVGTRITRIVLDVLKPRDPPIHELASRLASLQGIERANVSLAEIDQSTESIKVSIEGTGIALDSVRKTLEELGAVIHSVDEVSAAKKGS